MPQWTVTNQSTSGGTAVQPWTDRLLLSADAALGSDTFLGDLAHSSNLAAGGSYADMRDVTIPAGQAPGNYFILIQTDLFNQVSEEVETDNVLAQPITVTP